MRRFIVFTMILFLADFAFAGALLQIQDLATYANETAESVSTDILGQIATTTVTTHFSYDASGEHRLALMFPLPENANVIHAEYWLTDHWEACSLIVAEDTSVYHGGEVDSNVAEFLGSRPFILPLSDFYLDDVRIKFTYIELLDYDMGEITYNYPCKRPSFFTDYVDTLSISISLSTPREITDMNSSMTMTDIYHDEHTGTANLQVFDFYSTENFELTYDVASDSIGFTSMFYKGDSDTGFFLFIIEPPLNPDTSEIVPKDFIFVLDRSGSMSGSKIEQARESADSCIVKLHTADRFNVIAYNDEISSFSVEGLLPATESNKANAIDFVNSIDAYYGTNINDAMLTALDMFSGERLSEIIFLTDGLPTVGETNCSTIRENILAANTIDAAIYTFGIGYDVDSTFLSAIAFENTGVYFGVSEDNISEIVSELFDYINIPVLSHPELSIPSMTTFEIYPAHISAIFAGKQLIISGQYTGSGTSDVILSGRLATDDTEFVWNDISFPAYVDSLPFVATIWAKQFIDYWISYMDAYGEVDSIVDRVTDVALRYGIVCKYTTYYTPSDILDELGINMNLQPTDDGINITISISENYLVSDIQLQRSVQAPNNFNTIANITGSWYIDNTAPLGQRIYYRLKITLNTGEIVFSRTYETLNVPSGNFIITNATPNPFNTSIRFTISGTPVNNKEIEIFDVEGRMVKRITVVGNTAIWDGRDDKGVPVQSGIYFAKTSKDMPLKKIVLLK